MSYTTLVLTQSRLQAMLHVSAYRKTGETQVIVGYPSINCDEEVITRYMDLRGHELGELPNDCLVVVGGFAALEVPPEGTVYDGIYWDREDGRAFAVINGRRVETLRTAYYVLIEDLEGWYPQWRVWA